MSDHPSHNIRPILENELTREIIAFFMEQPIFDRINAEELKVVAKHMSEMTLEAGDTLFEEGDKGNAVYFVAQGELDVIKQSGENSDVNLATLKTGNSIGEMSIVDDDARSATVRARTTAHLYVLSKSAFDLVVARHSRIGIKVLMGMARLLSSHLRKTSTRLADYIPPIS